MEEKSEGALKTNAGHQSTTAQNGSNFGDANPTDLLEEQLKKAEETLRDLQALKTKLEEEKKHSQKAKDEEEKANVTKLRDENKKLKEEINSLKEVISSLKEDLSTTAEQFQSKVASSLKKLDAAKVELDAPKNTESIKEDQPAPSTNQPADVIHPNTNESTASPIVPEPASATAAPSEPDIREEKAIEDELSEYEKIKQELEALERDNVLLGGDSTPIPSTPALNVPATTAQSAAVPVVAPASGQTTASVQPVANITPTTPESAPAVKPQDSPSGFWGDKQITPPKEKAPKTNKQKFAFLKKINLPKKSEGKSKKSKDEAKNTKKEEIKPGAPGGKLAIKAAGIVMIVIAAGVAYQMANAENLRSSYTNQVKNAMTSIPAQTDPTETPDTPDEFAKQPIEARYKEAFADIPFDSTVWKTYNDPDYGIKIDYPENTSHQLRPTGSNNIWFLRKSGYLVKIERFDSDKSLEQFYTDLKTDVKYRIESSNVQGVPAMHLIQDEYLPIRGNIFLVKVDNYIYKIWYQTYAAGENPDDEKRVKRMMDSLRITVSSGSDKPSKHQQD